MKGPGPLSTHGGDDKPAEMSSTKKKALEEAAAELALAKATGEGGLSSSEAERAFKQWGPNELAEKKISPLMQFLGYLCVRRTRACDLGDSLTLSPPAL